jgi:hypothetical protein
MESTRLESGSLRLPNAVLKNALLKMLHIDGVKMLRRFLKRKPKPSSPNNKIIHNTSHEILSQFLVLFGSILPKLLFMPVKANFVVSLIHSPQLTCQ